jgi:hypothetical protein
MKYWISSWLIFVKIGMLWISKYTDFAYAGTQAGDYLITGSGRNGQAPSSMTQISSPNNSVLVIGRVQVYGDSDLPTAYGLAKQNQLAPPSQK